MSRTLRVLPEAEAELADAAAWYGERRPSLGSALIAEVDAAMSRITTAPEAAPLWRKGYPYRMRVLRRFPFVVFYVVDEAEIEVVAIAHAKRRPGYWLKRVQAF